MLLSIRVWVDVVGCMLLFSSSVGWLEMLVISEGSSMMCFFCVILV